MPSTLRVKRKYDQLRKPVLTDGLLKSKTKTGEGSNAIPRNVASKFLRISSKSQSLSLSKSQSLSESKSQSLSKSKSQSLCKSKPQSQSILQFYSLSLYQSQSLSSSQSISFSHSQSQSISQSLRSVNDESVSRKPIGKAKA
jgi:hypothetical protein